ncbi:TetR/AcrR family transcriptional regulator [Streptococcus panodentis]|uniref:TetR/AcrR family transcriptional regulator n=1 Tax=Streptococcus panodentis TaxID=1581472 RepID=A0ABS5AZJ5_9STRE|nr:TetR/AcrR family transcriptional regulator [Streptococcus panodentis]MBP2622007.1 TetR/AcrR family transcriptional regulator [Streptococcus panodentis]
MVYQEKNQQTEANIEKSFLELMKERSFEKITIEQLTDLADINRSTFYRHYADKYELIEKIEDRLLTELRSYYQTALQSAELVRLDKDFQVEDYIHGEQNFFKFFEPHLAELAVLLGEKGRPASLRKLQAAVRELFDQSISLASPHLSELQRELLLNHQTASFMGTLTYWLEHPQYGSAAMSDFHSKVTNVGLVGFVKAFMEE